VRFEGIERVGKLGNFKRHCCDPPFLIELI